jgi:predicted SpoU family rRNA methylase
VLLLLLLTASHSRVCTHKCLTSKHSGADGVKLVFLQASSQETVSSKSSEWLAANMAGQKHQW